jgi:hypothetical protein
MKSSQSTDGFNSIVNRAAARQVNTAGKVASAGRSRVYTGRGYEPSPMISTPAGSAFNRSRVGGQAMSGSKTAQSNVTITATSSGLAKQRKSANSVSKVGGGGCQTNNSIGNRSKECSLSGSSANVNALPKQSKKSPGKSFK